MVGCTSVLTTTVTLQLQQRMCTPTCSRKTTDRLPESRLRGSGLKPTVAVGAAWRSRNRLWQGDPAEGHQAGCRTAGAPQERSDRMVWHTAVRAAPPQILMLLGEGALQCPSNQRLTMRSSGDQF